MTNLRAAYEVRDYLRELGVKAEVDSIAIRHHDLVATIGYEVVVELPNGERRNEHVERETANAQQRARGDLEAGPCVDARPTE